MKKIKIVLSLTATLLLSGCASGCHTACIMGFGPGNPLFTAVANHYDNADGCQLKNKPPGYQLPSYCGSSKNKQTREVVRISRQGQGNTYIIDRQQ